MFTSSSVHLHAFSPVSFYSQSGCLFKPGLSANQTHEHHDYRSWPYDSKPFHLKPSSGCSKPALSADSRAEPACIHLFVCSVGPKIHPISFKPTHGTREYEIRRLHSRSGRRHQRAGLFQRPMVFELGEYTISNISPGILALL